jgi:hypothetical protein
MRMDETAMTEKATQCKNTVQKCKYEKWQLKKADKVKKTEQE